MILGLFDGHGRLGKEVSQWCAERLYVILLKHLTDSNYQDPQESLRLSFVETDARLGSESGLFLAHMQYTLTLTLRFVNINQDWMFLKVEPQRLWCSK
jgi:serine/threonine protein phosphatase PrpC